MPRKIVERIHKQYDNELEGQIDFYNELDLTKDVIMGHSTDGFTRGSLIELKLNLGSSTYGLSKARKQLFVEYPIKLINAGEYLPKYRIAVDLNNGKCIVYDEHQHQIDLLN
jgi:hypothetical protein